jgi:hypothetical protein
MKSKTTPYCNCEEPDIHYYQPASSAKYCIKCRKIIEPDVPYYFIERIDDHAWLTGSFQWTHDPNEAWKTTERMAMEEIVDGMFRNRCIVTEHLFIDTPNYKKEQDNADFQLAYNMLAASDMLGVIPSAFEWHNYQTGHCYVDYVAHPNMGEKDGYICIPLFKQKTVNNV